MPFSVAVTGHRPNKLWGYDINDPHYARLKKRFKEEIVRMGATDAYSGMALGVDIEFATAVLELRDSGYPIRLHAAVPCQNHSCRWPKPSVDRYNAVLARADEVVLVTDAPYSPRLMQVRNEYMVDRADRILAVWDGTGGGTANCVRYAYKRNVPVTIIHPASV